MRSAARRMLAALCVVFAAACTPHFGVTITNAPPVQDCVPGSVSKPCP